MSTDALGDRQKEYERRYESTAMNYVPLLARIDGRAFHSFTKGLNRPYDENLSKLMVETTKFLVDEMVANIGYTQSDEISLIWFQKTYQSQFPFGGRIQKLSSVLASLASAFFNKLLPSFLPAKSEQVPVFDARVWQVPSLDEAVNYFLWRERDAIRNSILMATSSVYSHLEMQNKNTSELQEMLFQKGINYNDYPYFFKRGTWVRRDVVVTVVMDSSFNRTKIEAFDADFGRLDFNDRKKIISNG